MTPLPQFEEALVDILTIDNMNYSDQILVALRTFTESLAVQVEAGKASATDTCDDSGCISCLMEDAKDVARTEDAAIIRNSVL